MLAVTANHTKVHYGVKHICLSHQRKVDKHHIDESSHLKTNLQYKVTEFNKEICDERLYHWKPERLRELQDYFTNLLATTTKLETDGLFFPI